MKAYEVEIKIFGKRFLSTIMAKTKQDAEKLAKEWILKQATIKSDTTDNNDFEDGVIDFFNGIMK